MPISSVAAVAGDVAVPPDSTVVPIDVPPVAQSANVFAATSVGSHKKNSTDPVGVGDGVIGNSLTKSVTDVPGITVDELVLAVVLIGASCDVVSKHSDTVLV